MAAIGYAQEQYKTHQVHKTLDDLGQQLQDKKPGNFENCGDDVKLPYERLRYLVDIFKSAIKKSDPLFTSVAILTEINNDLNIVRQHWNNYLIEPNRHWQALNNVLDPLLKKVVILFAPNAPKSISESIRSFIDGVHAEKDKLSKIVLDVQKVANESNVQFKQVEQKLDELKLDVDKQKIRLDTMLTEQTSVFNNSETSRNQKFTQAQQQQKEDFDAEIEEFTARKGEVIKLHAAKLNEIEVKSSQDSESLVEKIQLQLDKAVEIVGTIVTTSISGDYKLIANREYKNAWRMRLVALAFFGLMALMVGMVIYDLHGDAAKNWEVFAIRISLSLVFGLPGIYLAKESARHWSAEKNNRRLALELATLDPFINKLDESKRVEILMKKADEYFGGKATHMQGDDGFNMQDVHLNVNQLLKIAEKISKIVHPTK